MRDTITEETILGQRSDLAIGRFPEIYKMTPPNNLINIGEITLNALF